MQIRFLRPRDGKLKSESLCDINKSTKILPWDIHVLLLTFLIWNVEHLHQFQSVTLSSFLAIPDISKVTFANVRKNNRGNTKRKVGPQQIMKIKTNFSTTVQRWKLIIKIFPNCVVHSIITSNWGRLTKQTLKGNIIIFLRRLTAVLNKYSNLIVFHTQKYVKCNNHNV